MSHNPSSLIAKGNKLTFLLLQWAPPAQPGEQRKRKIFKSSFDLAHKWCHDTQHNDCQHIENHHNDTMHNAQ